MVVSEREREQSWRGGDSKVVRSPDDSACRRSEDVEVMFTKQTKVMFEVTWSGESTIE